MADKQTPIADADTTEYVDQAYARAANRSEFFGFSRPRHVFSLDKNDQVVSRALEWPMEPVSVPTDGHQFFLPFEVSGARGPVALPLGLTIISGPTAGGKSSFVRAWAKRGGVMRLVTVEPHDTSAEIMEAPTFSSVDGALASAVMALYGSRDVLPVIDSLRAPLFETPGAAGSKGLSMPFFTQITRVSNALARAGLTVAATVNPMDEDAEYVKAFLSKLSASVPAMISLDRVDSGQRGTPSRFTGSLQLRPNRTPMPFVFDTTEKPSQRERSVEFAFPPEAGDNLIINRVAVRAASSN